MSRTTLKQRKMKKENEPIEVCGDIICRTLQLLVGIYIFLVMVVMPFYNTDGYTKIGTNKYEFFKMTTQGMVWILLPLLMVYLVYLLLRWKRQGISPIGELSVTDRFALLYAVGVLLSYFFSAYRGETPYGDAWQGTKGWYMGARSQLTFVASYFLISRFFKEKRLLWLLLPVVTVLFSLGYLNRFGIYPIKMEAANPLFISMIGNVNWYCGYLVTVFFCIVGCWLAGRMPESVRNAFAVLLFIGFATLVTQGSMSGIFVLVVMLLVLYLSMMQNGEGMGRFWLMCSILFAACTMTLLVRRLFPVAITFEDAMMNLLTNTLLPVAGLMVCLVLYLTVRRKNREKAYPVKVFCRLGYIGMGGAIFLLIAYLLLLILNTVRPGSIGSLSELGIFIFDGSWASNRGATFRAGVQTFLDQSLLHKLFGVGPDCMAMHIYIEGSSELLELLTQQFHNQTLTNAHCEWLTILADTGIVGAVGYIGMMVSAIVRYLRERDTSALVFGCGCGLFAFTINNVFSFQQAMNTTTMFLVLGIGEALSRQDGKGAVIDKDRP